MSKSFYRAISGTGESLKKAWDYAVGDKRLLSRGLQPHTSLKMGCLLGGAFLGLFGGEIAALSTSNIWLWPLAIGAGALLPVPVHATYSIYQAGKHDYKIQQLEDRRKGQLKLPAPRPGEPLI